MDVVVDCKDPDEVVLATPIDGGAGAAAVLDIGVIFSDVGVEVAAGAEGGAGAGAVTVTPMSTRGRIKVAEFTAVPQKI